MGVHFKPYLPFVVPPLLKSAALDPELQVCDADEADDEPDEDGVESVTVAIRGQARGAAAAARCAPPEAPRA